MRDWWLVAYDVRDDRRLRRVAKHMEGYGERLQYSLFRCHLSKREVERLRWELSKILMPSDSLMVIGLCGTCAARVRNAYSRDEWPAEPPGYIIM